MHKTEFMKRLERALSPMTKEERERSLAYYGEMIDDRMENGCSEEEAVAACGSVEDIAAEILADAQGRGALKPRRGAFDTSLLIIGSPLWVALLIVAAALLIAMYAVVWAVIISLFAVVAALGIAGVAGLAGCVMLLSNPAAAAMALGAGLICASLGIFLCTGSIYLAKWLVRGTGEVWKRAWDRILKKDGENK